MNPSIFNSMVPIAPASTPQSTFNFDDLHRKKRTRAKRSCDLCRKKKTRCDAASNQPCTKCKLANTECLFLVEQKKRGPSTGSYVEVLEARLLRMEKLIQNIAQEKQHGQGDDSSEKHDRHDRSSSASSSIGCSTILGDLDECGNNEVEKEGENNTHSGLCPLLLAKNNEDDSCDNLEEHMNKLTISDYQRTRYIGASSGVHFLGDTLLHSGKKHRIPHEPSWFVQKLNDDIDEHVIMKSKEVPPPQLPSSNRYIPNRIDMFEDTPHLTQELADYLVDMFFTQVHIYCPIINKTQFLEEYYFHQPNPPDKYLLYAITTIGTALFLPDISVTRHFDFTKEQIAEIYTVLKAKTDKLLSILHRRSMISTVQTLMLLSMFVGHDDSDDEDTSHWFITGMAIRMAQDLGLHRDCSKWNIPDYEIELRKRIWYSAYMMDRWVAAELGRPVSILDHEFDVELPNPFELNTPPSQHKEFTPTLVLEAESALSRKTPIYASFLHLVTLSQIAGQVLVGFHSTRAKKYRQDNFALLNILDRSLTNWKLSLPEELKWDLSKSNNMAADNSKPCILSMACDCVRLLLYRPFIKTNTEQPENTALAVKALSICTASATNLVITAECMEPHSFMALPWNMAVYAVFQAAIIFLHNAKGENDFIKEQGKSYLRRCARLYTRDPFLRTTRVVKVLQQYMANFEIYMDDECGSSSKHSSPPSCGSRRKRADDLSLTSPITNTSHDRQTREFPEDKVVAFTTSKAPDNSVIAAAIKPPGTEAYDVSKEPINITGTTTATAFNPFITTDLNSNMTTPRLEDMFLSSLSFGFDKNTLNDIFNLQQQQVSNNEIVDPMICINTTEELNLCPSNQQQQRHQQCDSSPNSFFNSNGTPPEKIDHNNNNNSIQQPLYKSQQQQQFDIASLSSEIPIWELPSGVTWNEWESFLKSNV